MGFPDGYILSMVAKMCNAQGFIPDMQDLIKARDKYLLIASKLN